MDYCERFVDLKFTALKPYVSINVSHVFWMALTHFISKVPLWYDRLGHPCKRSRKEKGKVKGKGIRVEEGGHPNTRALTGRGRGPRHPLFCNQYFHQDHIGAVHC